MRIAIALGLSVALHLVGFGFVRTVRPRSSPLVVRPVDTVDIVVSGRASGVGPTPPQPIKRERVRKRSGAVLPSPVKVATQASASPVAAPVPFLPEAEQPAVDEAASDAASGAQQGRAPIPDPSPATLDLRPFFQRLQAAAQHCAGARKGEARVRFCVDPFGSPTEVSIVQSSGNFALDDAALNCVIPGAAPFPLSDRCLVVPLVFR